MSDFGISRRALIAGCALLALATPGFAAAAPDTIYVNAKVVTVDPQFSIKQAVAVTGDKISAVGSTADVRKLAGPGTKVVDLGGKPLLPGFAENHGHLGGELQDWKWGGMIGAGRPWMKGADTIAKVQAGLKTQTDTLPKGTWITASLPREDWPNGTLPTAADLDVVSPDHPVAISRGHSMIVNTAGMKLAKITRTTDVEGGRIDHLPDGEPNGIIHESARKLVEGIVPRAQQQRGSSPEEEMAGWYKMLLQWEELGITSANVPGIRPPEYPMVNQLYAKYGDHLPRLVVQLRVYPGTDEHDDIKEGVKITLDEINTMAPNRATILTHPRTKVGAIKMSIDGGMSAPVYWSTVPYVNRPDGYQGEIRIPDWAFYEVAKRANELGWQLGVHTMGDGATIMVADQMAKVLAEHPRPDHRNYMHHVAVPLPEATMRTMAANKIGVASQPGFTLALGSYADESLSPERAARQNPVKTLVDHGIRVSFGADAAPTGPITAIFAAVTRMGWNGKVHGPEEAVSVQEAIRMHTMEPAYFNFDEKVRGSIEVGKLADLVVLSDDLLTMDPMKISDVKVLRTIIGGKEVYTRPMATALK